MWTTSASIAICAARRRRTISRAMKTAATASSTNNRRHRTRKPSARKPWRVVLSKPLAMMAHRFPLKPPPPPRNQLRSRRPDDARVASPACSANGSRSASIRTSHRESRQPYMLLGMQHTHTHTYCDLLAYQKRWTSRLTKVLARSGKHF